MDVILCHTTADFDALGAAVGLTRLKAGAKIVLPGGAHPVVRDFLALHRDEFALMERRSINPEQIRSVTIVDTQQRDRKSEIVRSLRRYDLPTLILIAVQSPRDVRRKIWRYLTDWINVKAPLNGNDLKALGYKPGPQYSKMLDDLLAATLDGAGVVCDRADAEFFLAKHSQTRYVSDSDWLRCLTNRANRYV